MTAVGLFDQHRLIAGEALDVDPICRPVSPDPTAHHFVKFSHELTDGFLFELAGRSHADLPLAANTALAKPIGVALRMFARLGPGGHW